jgi:translation initiation factor IF-3
VIKLRLQLFLRAGKWLMFIERTAEYSKVESPMKMEGKHLLVILAPQKAKGKKII